MYLAKLVSPDYNRPGIAENSIEVPSIFVSVLYPEEQSQ